MENTTWKKLVGGMLVLSALMMLSACKMNHNQPSSQPSQSVATDSAQDSSQAPAETEPVSSTQVPVKDTYTEEEKAAIEAQDGVTVDENGIIQVDVSDMFE